MKKLLLSVIAVAAFATTKAQVVFQSDFENWTTTTNPSGWLGTKSYTPSIAQQYSVSAYSGTLAAQCTNTSTTTHRRFTTQPLSITSGTSYKVNFYAQGNGQVRTAIYKGGNSYGTYNSYITVNGTSWTHYSQNVIADTTSATAEFIFSVLGTSGANNLLLDSVTIVATGTVAPQPFLSLATIQTPTNTATGDSPYAGQIVKTGGIVTAIATSTAGTANGFYIESATAAPYSGIFAYSTTYAPTVALGDSVNFSGTISEFYGMTEISTLNSFVKVSSGNAVPAPIAMSPISNLKNEQYEAMLVSVANVTCTTTPNTYLEWTVASGANTATIGSKLYTYTPTVGSIYNIKGVVFDNVSGSNHYWTLQPRFASDITASSVGITEYSKDGIVAVYPNPATSVVTISLKNNAGVKQVTVTDVMGRMVYSSTENTNTVDVSRFEAGIYNVVISTENASYQTKLIVQK